MKRPWPRALLLLSFLVLSACGGGGGGGPANKAPIANFAFVCADLVCTFKNISSDSDVGDSITAYHWTFGDGAAAGTAKDEQHSYTAGGTYDVSLTVTDRAGATGSAVKTLTVTAPTPAPAAVPHASFSVSCVSLDCTFTDNSTYDSGSTFQSRAWDFGDTGSATTNPATHHFNATTLTSFSVKLTITDAAGHTSTSTQSLPLAPPVSTLNCVGGNCVLQLPQAATVTATLVSSSCGARGNQVVITAPITETVFTDGCFTGTGSTVTINGGAAFAANTVLTVEVRSGLSGTTRLAFAPAIRVTGDFANGWTVVFDDGFGGPGEPDFNDLVILIKATP